jgi:hypothetical protein
MRRIFKQYPCDFEVKDVVFESVYSDYIIARIICKCRICGSTKWWRISISTNRGYSFYTWLTKWVVKTGGFCGPVERWEVGVSYTPSEGEWARLEEEAIKIIDRKRKDRRWWNKNIGVKPMRHLLASTIYYLARKEGKNIPQRPVAERYKINEQTIRNHRSAVTKLLEDASDEINKPDS